MNKERKHTKIQKILFHYVAGQLPEKRNKAVVSHLEQCSQCREEVDRFNRQRAELQETPLFQLDDDLFAQIREKTAAAYQQSIRPDRPYRRPLSWLFQPAALITLILLLSFLIYGAAVIKSERLIAFNLPFSLFQPLNAT